MKRYWLLGGLILILILAACNTTDAPLELQSESVSNETIVYTGQGFKNGELETVICDPPELGQDGSFVVAEDGGYLKWILTANNATFAKLIGPWGEFDMIQAGGGAWHKATDYYPLDVLLEFPVRAEHNHTGPGNVQLTVSNGCPGEGFEELTVEKTAVTSFTREHFWDIAKKVETENEAEHEGYPKIWLYENGDGDETATWTVDVTYEGYEDSHFNISGDITIKNTGTLDAVITSIEDLLAEELIDIDCGEDFVLPYTLSVGDTLTCTYNENVDGKVEGFNEVTVTTERDEYFDDAEIIWGEPTTEINETVNVKDISDLFGKKNLGTATAPDDAKFTYYKHFAWQDYGRDNCGDFTYDNTATIVETDQSADATLKVNVQCLIFDDETAWAANGHKPGELRYTSRGNWATYVKYQGFAATGKTTTLFAGQTINVGTVNFSAAAGGQVIITVSLTGAWEFEDVSENLKVQDYATAPSGNPAPGLFAHKKTCDSDENTCTITVPANNFYGVHVNVGQWIPDPNFGP